MLRHCTLVLAERGCDCDLSWDLCWLQSSGTEWGPIVPGGHTWPRGTGRADRGVPRPGPCCQPATPQAPGLAPPLLPEMPEALADLHPQGSAPALLTHQPPVRLGPHLHFQQEVLYGDSERYCNAGGEGRWARGAAPAPAGHSVSPSPFPRASGRFRAQNDLSVQHVSLAFEPRAFKCGLPLTATAALRGITIPPTPVLRGQTEAGRSVTALRSQNLQATGPGFSPRLLLSNLVTVLVTVTAG